MQLTPEQFARIAHCLPEQRGNVSLSNLQVVNAILYILEHDCRWRGLPAHFGNWHTIYTRMKRWNKAGVIDRLFEELQKTQIIRIRIEAGLQYFSLGTEVAVQPGDDAEEKEAGAEAGNFGSPTDHEMNGQPRFIWLPRKLKRT